MREIEVYAQSAVSNIPSIIFWILLGVLIVGFAVIYLNHNDNASCWLREVARLMLVEWIVLIFCSAVVFRNTRTESAISLVPLSSYFCIAENSYLKEVAVINLLNVVMFVPVGALLRGCNLNVNLNNNNANFVFNSWKGAMVVGLLLSIAIEVLQFVFRKGLCEIDDVIHNVIGCMLGFGIATLTLTLTVTVLWKKK